MANLAAALLTLLMLCGSARADAAGTLQARLRARLAPETAATEMFCSSERLCGSELLPVFYARRGFSPAWFDGGTLRIGAAELIAAIRDARRHGLDPTAYHLAVLDRLTRAYRAAPSPDTALDLELLLTDAFLLLAAHLSTGRVDPETIEAEWHIDRGQVDLVNALQDALAPGRIAPGLTGLAPPGDGYRRLMEALAAHRRILGTGGWPHLPPGPAMKPGRTDDRLPIARERLRITGDLTITDNPEPTVLDDALERAVRRFQERHGLEVDGIVGRDTRGAMNVPAEARILQIEANLERLRWLPHDLSDRRLVVNIADFALTLVEGGRERLSMDVIVGKPYRRTPVFSGSMTYLEVNPYWNVPPKLALEDVLPRIQNDPDYLAAEGFRVLANWGAGAPEVDPAAIDWQALGSAPLPFRLQQLPGPQNALGRIKFMFPNKFAVYLHDTPARHLFKETSRTFSSGCIRISRPLELARHLLSAGPDWDPDAFQAMLDSGENRTIVLPQPLPVSLLYLTAWVDDDGRMHFRRDVYERDAPLAAALHGPPPR